MLAKVNAKGGRLSYRTLLRNSSLAKDELGKIIETLVLLGDIAIEKGPRGGEILVAG